MRGLGFGEGRFRALAQHPRSAGRRDEGYDAFARSQILIDLPAGRPDFELTDKRVIVDVGRERRTGFCRFCSREKIDAGGSRAGTLEEGSSIHRLFVPRAASEEAAM